MNVATQTGGPGAAAGPGLDLSGWFCVGLSAELGPGEVRPVRFFGEDFVLFRTSDGGVSMLDAHCPHLGAHLGHGGRVEADRIVCPFHGFAFDRDGRCVGTAHDERPPRNADLRRRTVVEQGGLILTWYAPDGASPTWELPSWDTAGFSQVRGIHTRIATHPQETTENSVDLTHFGYVHGYHDVRIHRPVAVQGTHLSITYRMRRPLPGLEWVNMPVEFHVDVHGVGLSIVTVRPLGTPMTGRLFILACPTDSGHLDLRAVTQVRVNGLERVGGLGRLLRDLSNRFLLHSVEHDVEQDRRLWEHKRYEERPRIARSDGPIGRYRQYVRQFYAESS